MKEIFLLSEEDAQLTIAVLVFSVAAHAYHSFPRFCFICVGTYEEIIV